MIKAIETATIATTAATTVVATVVAAATATLLLNTQAHAEDFIDQAVQAEHREQKNRARDKWRNPAETLRFFGLQQDHHVLEILPGRGWYTEILAAATKNGKLTAASFGNTYPNQYLVDIHNDFIKKIEATPQAYSHVNIVSFHSPDYTKHQVPEGSIDMVLTFRNTHNWLRDGLAETVYKEMARMLRKGGILGVVQHRATDPEQSHDTGYVSEQKVIELAEQAGLKLVARSEINANPKDNHKHPKGVWTLPPTLRLKEQDKEKYQQIGESDRMTLKFIK